MTWSFRPASRSEAKPLIGLYSLSGCGKTLSALLLARGYVGPGGKVGMIETESGRGEAFADDPRVAPYIVCPMRGDFSPTNYGETIAAAEEEKLAALIIDSASHEWEAIGGVLHMADQNRDAGKKGPLVWQQPKLDHARQFMLRLLSSPIPLIIVNMRAKYPMKEVKDGNEKKWVRIEQLEPIQSDGILYEMFVHGWIDSEHRFHGTKYTTDALRKVLVTGEPISIETGKRLAAWSRESVAPAVTTTTASEAVDARKVALDKVGAAIAAWFPGQSETEKSAKGRVIRNLFKKSWADVAASQPVEDLEACLLGGDDSRLNKACADQKAAMVA